MKENIRKTGFRRIKVAVASLLNTSAPTCRSWAATIPRVLNAPIANTATSTAPLEVCRLQALRRDGQSVPVSDAQRAHKRDAIYLRRTGEFSTESSPVRRSEIHTVPTGNLPLNDYLYVVLY